MAGIRVVDITRTTSGPLPHIPFEALASKILGTDYSLSLVLCADTLARRLHRTYTTDRKKPAGYSPNVLSFPIGKREGEIFLNIRKAAREARALNMRTPERIAHLFVHGCLHLAGLRHGKKMDKAETRVLKQAGFEK